MLPRFYAAQHGSAHVQGEGLAHKLQAISERVDEVSARLVYGLGLGFRVRVKV